MGRHGGSTLQFRLCLRKCVTFCAEQQGSDVFLCCKHVNLSLASKFRRAIADLPPINRAKCFPCTPWFVITNNLSPCLLSWTTPINPSRSNKSHRLFLQLIGNRVYNMRMWGWFMMGVHKVKQTKLSEGSKMKQNVRTNRTQTLCTGNHTNQQKKNLTSENQAYKAILKGDMSCKILFFSH